MEETTGKYRVLGIYLLLAGFTFVTYKQVLSHQFINLDDNVYVSENPHVQSGLSWQNIRWAFAAPHLSFWHPLTMLSHMLDCELFGLEPWGHHLSSLLLHIANTLILFLVLKGMTGALWKSAFVAALFALHPLHVESVAWIAERKDVLSTLFWMLTLAGYLWYVRRPGTARYLVTLFVFVLGLMAKPMLVTLPFVLLLLDYWPLERLNRRTIYEKLPFFALSAIFSIIVFFAQRSEDALSLNLPLGIRIANALVSYLSYIGKMIWPVNLAVFYPHPGKNLEIKQAVFAFILLLSITIWMVSLARRHKYLLVGWLWYLGTLVPVIGLVQVGSFAMADRYTYIPLTGLFIIIAWGFDELFIGWQWRETALGISAAAALFVLSMFTGAQLRYWQNSVTLFERALKVTNSSALAHNNLGFAYIKLGRYNEVIENCKQAVRIKPDCIQAYVNLGVAYIELGRYDEAVEALKQAVKIKPDVAEAYYNLGIVYDKLGRYQEAIEAFEQAIRIKPDSVEAHNNLGVAYRKLGNFEKAIEAFKQAIEIKPDSAEAHNNLGTVYGQLGRYDETIEEYKKAVHIKPDYAEAHYNLGMAYIAKGDNASALEEYKILKGLDAGMSGKLFRLIYK